MDEQGEGLPYAQAAALDGDRVLAVFSADGRGALHIAESELAATHLVVGAQGYANQVLPAKDLPSLLQLQPVTAAETGPFLRFRPPVSLLCDAVDAPPPYSCGAFGEPVMEVAGDGTIWASATCCIGRSPPIWTSRDGGATFQLLRGEGTGLVRDATGIEGDFAIDDAGNVYFFDTLAATAWFTSYALDGTHRWTVPIVLPPLVDRPWVRAAAPDEVFLVYNTGVSTRFYRSADGGLTWDLTRGASFPCASGVPGQGPTRDDLYVAIGCQGPSRVWTSRDGGLTWDDGQTIPRPEADFAPPEQAADFHIPVADEAGNLYVAYIRALPDPEDTKKPGPENAVFVARRDASGQWAGPWQVGPSGHNAHAWPAAGSPGRLGLAWYHADATKEAEDREWRLMSAVSLDADAPTPHFQVAIPDSLVLHRGSLARSLGDFLQADLTPDGRFAIVYALDDRDVVNRFVSSDGVLDLAPDRFLNGPRPA